MLEVINLNAGYGKLQVLFNVSLRVPEKSITVVVGPNGSGKSTLLKTIFGLTKVYSGKILFCGEDVTNKPPHKIAQTGLTYMPQIGNVFENLTVRENLLMATYGLDENKARDRIEEALSLFPVLKTYMDRRVSTLSGGERQMLGITIVMIRNPKLIMMDEPTAALSPKIAYQVLRAIEKLRDEYGKTVLLVEQNAKAALEIGDNAVLMVSGQVVYSGDATTLLERRDLGSMYLGLTSS